MESQQEKEAQPRRVEETENQAVDTSTTAAPSDAAHAPVDVSSVCDDTNIPKDSSSTRLRTDEWLHERLLTFQRQRHSLRLSASNVAAMAGLHPWKQLPELLMQLVYQGRDGQLLLQRDSENLGLVLQSEEQILEQLAAKAGPATRQALQSALQVKQGTQQVSSVETAKRIKEKVVKEAQKTGKLQANELKVLREGSRSAVDTGYGIYSEDQALDLYQRQMGWEVTDRNAEIREWPFVRAEDVPRDCNANMEEKKEAMSQPTVVPLRDASNRDVANSTSSCVSSKRQKIFDLSASDSSTTGTSSSSTNAAARPVEDPTMRPDVPPPFFVILGSVDGILQEVTLNPRRKDEKDVDGDDDADSLIVRNVIVEIKHRLRRMHKTPPLYEQIQAAAYCLMYQVDQADIVQVLRNEGNNQKRKAPPQSKEAPRLMEAVSTCEPIEVTNSDDSKLKLSAVQPISCQSETMTESSLEVDTKPASADDDRKDSAGAAGRRAETNKCTASAIDLAVHQQQPLTKLGSCQFAVVGTKFYAGMAHTGDSVRLEQEPTNEYDCNAIRVSTLRGTQIGHIQKEAAAKLAPVMDRVEALTLQAKVCGPSNNTSTQVSVDLLTKSNLVEPALRSIRAHLQDSFRPEEHNITISVNRISLDDPILQHRQNWEQLILPRLRSFVEAVFCVRSDDDKRYRLLMSISDPLNDTNMADAWQILHQECPWLESCDTAFHRDL